MQLSQFFMDDTNAFSMKRLAFFTFTAAYILAFFLHYQVDSLERIIVWLGGFILAEDVAPAVAHATLSNKH